MAEHPNKGKKFGRPFRPGQSGNPGGKPAGISEAQALLNQDKETFLTLMHEYANITLEQLKRVLANPKTKTNQACIARLYSKAIGGSFSHLTEILGRICGPIPKHDKLGDEGESGLLPSLHGYSADTLTAVMVKLKREAEAVECSVQNPSPRSLESSSPSSPLEYLTES